MKVEILTPKGLELAVEAKTVIAPTLIGEIAVLENHIPIISVLKAGKLTIKSGEKDITREIEGGILEFAKDKMVILLKRF
ncbi:MAG TPA: F0F1 ATP synthase subunit epsilon [Candidatus Paceibacterota bacterium]|nr:F0F1 ATP synthase subunit epsilon [Candidatus Pacearchaeota archaeon]HRZ51074.1 F0F1 ATP synthase subunit epsilon [Candidatus Paceibacterota bacterium]HSA36767.1 F0F1 ATP synthase subunit epsilon [Candidatus Paceibacterota bacterium]